MASFVFNRAKGRVAEFVTRVDTNDPPNSAIVVLVLRAAALEADAVLIDKDSVQDLLSGTTDEATNAGYARLVLTDANITLPAPDDANDRFDVALGDLNFGAISAGDAWAKIVICYDSDTTAGTDANIIPLTCHDFAITPDGSIVTADEPPEGFFRAA